MFNSKSLAFASLLSLSLALTGPVLAAGSLFDGTSGLSSTGTAVLEATVPGVVKVEFGPSDTSAEVAASQVLGGGDVVGDEFTVTGSVTGNAGSADLTVTQTDPWSAGLGFPTLVLKNTTSPDTLTASVTSNTYGTTVFTLNGGATIPQGPLPQAFNFQADIDEASISISDPAGAYTATVTFTSVAF